MNAGFFNREFKSTYPVFNNVIRNRPAYKLIGFILKFIYNLIIFKYLEQSIKLSDLYAKLAGDLFFSSEEIISVYLS